MATVPMGQPSRLALYLDLIRWSRPAGWLLLLWPTLAALWLAAGGFPGWHLLAVFVLGTILMRSAGCCVNDVADREFDKHVKRTAQRPVTSGKVSTREALAVGAVLALVAFALVLTTNTLTVFMSFAALAITLALLAAVLLLVRWWVGAGQTWWSRRWVWGAVALAVLATLNLVLAGQPWGVVYGFGLWAAKGAVALGVFDPTTNAFWSQEGNALRLAQTAFMDVTSITNIGILGGALLVAAGQGDDSRALTRQQWVIGLLAGFVMGYSSRLALGCNVGAMVSGISTGSLHGWLWVPLAFGGTLMGLRVRRRFGF